MSAPFGMSEVGVVCVTVMNGLDELGRKQYGLVSREQAIGAGLSDAGIRWRIRSGDWEKFRRGVYRFRGSTVTWSQKAMDSYHWHHHRERFERDARQRNTLALLKWTNVVVTKRTLADRGWSDTLKRLLLPP